MVEESHRDLLGREEAHRLEEVRYQKDLDQADLLGSCPSPSPFSRCRHRRPEDLGRAYPFESTTRYSLEEAHFRVDLCLVGFLGRLGLQQLEAGHSRQGLCPAGLPDYPERREDRREVRYREDLCLVGCLGPNNLENNRL